VREPVAAVSCNHTYGLPIISLLEVFKRQPEGLDSTFWSPLSLTYHQSDSADRPLPATVL
jgi:hypothetical protein